MGLNEVVHEEGLLCVNVVYQEVNVWVMNGAHRRECDRNQDMVQVGERWQRKTL